MKIVVLFALLCLASRGSAGKNKNKQPHILHMVADDLGWDDISWYNPTMITPNLQDMADNGVILDNMYVQTSCSPTRSCLMTGYYSAKIGSQHLVYKPDRPHGLPTWLTTLPEILQSKGYATYGVGKWHLGYCNESYIPINRGFDHFYGFYLGSVDYYTHLTSEKGPYGSDALYYGYDFRDDGEKVEGEGVDGVYSSLLFREKLLGIINGHDANTPMYLYLAFQLPHSPLTVPDEYKEMYDGIVTNDDRKTYSGQVTLMDEIIGNVRSALEDAGMWDDTFVLFHSDNGGDVKYAASNFPLRGNKGTYFDGGIKAVAMAHGKGIEKTGYVSNEMMHAVDVFPTFIEASGGKTKQYDIDGVSAWKMITKQKKSKRSGFLITIDEDIPNESYGAAIRDGKWKLIQGYPAFSFTEQHLYWYETPYHTEPDEKADLPLPDEDSIFLFDMEADPSEECNVADDNPDVVAEMLAKLDEYRAVTWTDFPPDDPNCDPALTDNWWTTGWCTIN
ncbi:arylsulfatase B-like isoform X1 [Ptychodera flava]|uniref:arylsulfatase B-like isoform X1 n=1 Tax=Ptychodera flava TaxID=63121 RepID=UPI00396A22C4